MIMLVEAGASADFGVTKLELGHEGTAGGAFGTLVMSLLAMITARNAAIGRRMSGWSKPMLTLVK